MRDETVITKKDRSADMKELDDLVNKLDDAVLEKIRQQVFKEVSQKHFDEWLAAASNPVPHWGTRD